MDITRDFEIRMKKREQEKLKKLDDLYKNYDLKALELKDLSSPGRGQSTPFGDLNEEGKTELQIVEEEKARQKLLAEMREERDKLIRYFDKETDLKEKILIQDVK